MKYPQITAFCFIASAATVGVGLGSCTERNTEEACYFDDTEDAAKYVPPMAWQDWCNYQPGQVSPLVEEYCPAGECIDFFTTCDEVSVDQQCETCPAEEIDAKVLVAIGARYEERCPESQSEIIDFERGCMFERQLASLPEGMKQCCYTAVVVGECAI